MTRLRRRTLVVTLLVLVVAGGLGFHAWSQDHMRRMSGLADVSRISCANCHGRGSETLPWSAIRPKHPMPAGLVVSRDGDRLYVACSGTDEVECLDARTGDRLASAPVEGTPHGLALGAKGERLFVSCRDAARLVVLDARSLMQLDAVDVGMDPVAVEVVEREDCSRIVVANAGSGDLSILDGQSLQEIARLAAGRQPFAISSSSGGDHLLIANRLARITAAGVVPVSEATLVDPWQVRVIRRVPLRSAHMSEGAAFFPGVSLALVPLVMVRNLVPITQVADGWVMSSGLAFLDLARDVCVQLPLDEANACFADPSGVAVHPNGRVAWVAAGGADVITVIDIERLRGWLDAADGQARDSAARDLQLAPEYVTKRIGTAANPRHLVLTPRGETLFVSEHLNDTVLAIDTATNTIKARFDLGPRPPEDPAWRGARLFASASTSFQGQFSCRSCHPDGHVDGLAYDFDIDGVGRNTLDNRSLRGVALTGPFKWNGKNSSLQVQCGVRFAKVLTRTSPIAGRDLEDLVAYIESLPPMMPLRDLDPESVARGRNLFFATHSPDGKEIPRGQRCSTCHSPPFYSNGIRTAVSRKEPLDDHVEFDVPHLVGIGASAPYMHDGRAATLEEIWTLHNPDDTHGITSSYSKHDMNDLVEFLKSL